ncbi:hypothetical protein QCA50_001288 [Cerrena zonata]|uniref:Uncharacterized protein n=1 Tax=Cerrena zonata TaxID=2478898 RepID=A0AAW0GTP2_9APHY
MHVKLVATRYLEDEPELKYSRFVIYDGNDSLKRIAKVGDRQVADARVFTDTDYFLTREFVDQYANEVPRRQTKAPPVHANTDDEDDPEPDETAEPDDDPGGDPTDGSGQNDDETADPCVKNWKAAAEDSKKRSWGIFDENGLFASACRHGLILWLADMVKSGELAKYLIAMVAKLLDTLDDRTLNTYDIGCKFLSTIRNSSLSETFFSKGHNFIVNAFHGYTHSYNCQLRHHPNITVGAGLENFETLERVFSSSNQLASITRYASAFRCRLFIDLYFRQWDEEKYANLGTFIYNNYRQALRTIAEDTEALQCSLEILEVTPERLEELGKEANLFFSTLGKERPWDVHAVIYVELLQRLRQLDSQRTSNTIRFNNTIPNDYSYTNSTNPTAGYWQDTAQTRQLEKQPLDRNPNFRLHKSQYIFERRVAIEEHSRVLNEVIEMELRMGIDASERWQPTSPEYVETLQYIAERRYHQALNSLHKVVIQRLFELHKLNLAQTGYKLRTHLSKSLKNRSKTIRRAVAEYNIAARLLHPPRPALDASTVIDYSFLNQFSLLQDTRNDIRDSEWARTGIREAVKLQQHIKRAQEEVVRCNIEIRRLHTGIRDEHRHFASVLEELRKEDSPMYGVVEEFVERQRAVNRDLLRRVYDMYALPGLTGVASAGRRLGAPPDSTSAEEENPILDLRDNLGGEDDGEDDDEDDTITAIDNAIQVFSILSV